MFKKIQDHFKQPKGFIGRLVGKKMVAENKTLNKWTIKQLVIRSDQNLLEVGYGPGYAIDVLLKRYDHVHVDGIDISEAMKEEASHRLERALSREKVQLRVADISKSTLPNNHYDIVYAINNFNLWDSRHDGLCTIYSGMRHNGQLAITMQPRQEDVNKNKATDFANEIKSNLKSTGFQGIKTRYKRISPETAVCITAFKP